MAKILDIINTDKSARELLAYRVAVINEQIGFENHICCGQGAYVASLRDTGLTVHVIDQPRGLAWGGLLAALWRYFRLMRRQRYDIVHTHGSLIGVIGRLAARLAGTRVVIHQIHGFHHHERMRAITRATYIAAERLAARWTDHLLFQNENDRDECLKRKIASAAKLTVIGNGVNLNDFIQEAESSDPPLVILCVARFEPVKNHRQLFDAVKIMRDRGVRFRLQLVGDGPERPIFQAWADDEGLSSCVEFLGYREDVANLTRCANICVLTSIKEGIPRAAIEAAACGRPIVATDVSGTRSAVLHGQTGYLVPLGDAVALAGVLEALLGDAQERTRLGANAREWAANRFDEFAIARRIIALYRTELAKRSTPTSA